MKHLMPTELSFCELPSWHDHTVSVVDHIDHCTMRVVMPASINIKLSKLTYHFKRIYK